MFNGGENRNARDPTDQPNPRRAINRNNQQDGWDDHQRQQGHGQGRMRGRNRGGRGGGGGRREHREREHPMGFRHLKELEASDNLGEILQTMADSMSGFKLLLQSQDLPRHQMMVPLLNILARVCDYKGARATLIQVMNEVRNSALLTQLPGYYVLIMTDHQSEKYVEPVKASCKLFHYLLTTMPVSARQVYVPYTILDRVVKMNKFPDEVLEEVAEIGDICQELMKSTKDTDNSHDGSTGAPNTDDSKPPPNDFREIPVVPTTEDVQIDEVPFLRANKVEGAYQDLEHYLDVQFRLLREDFVRPLRDGISEYLKTIHEGTVKGRLTDVRIYNKVQVLYPVCTSNGVSHRIKFDIEHLKRIRWQNTKRLIFGSLLCLSHDNFQTLYFAVVTNRDVKLLTLGEVEVQFVEDINNIPPNQLFVMAETTAYFEAYRHVLNGLQTIQQDLPFQRYLIKAEKNVNCPKYLSRKKYEDFDMSCICQDLQEIEKQNQPSFGEVLAGLNIDENRSVLQERVAELRKERIVKKVSLLDEKTWPTPETLRLDRPQFDALRVALTKELAIIQGPPGTGKTYIGLKIVRCLLHNKSFWQTQEHSPILVVCYTNHALDQFLEGIHEYCRENIVRVGGRSKSDVLSGMNLRELRRKVRFNRTVPQAIHRGGINARMEMESLEKKMGLVTAKIAKTEQAIIHDDIVQEFMTDLQYESLKGFYSRDNIPEDLKTLIKRPCQLTEWIGLGDFVFLNQAVNDENNQLMAPDAPFHAEEIIEEEIEAEEEAELEERRRVIEIDDEFDLGRERAIQQQLNEEMAQLDVAFDINDMNVNAEMQEGNWQVQNKKKQKQKLRQRLKSTDAMTEQQALQVFDVWTLPLPQRWRLYRYWINLYKAGLREGIRDYENQYQNAANRLKENMNEEDAFVMKTAKVIGMTTTGAAKYRDILQVLKPKIVVVEEAAEVLEAHIVTALSADCEHLILIGDHKQLRPNPTVFELAEKMNLKISLFERLIKNEIPHETLEKQHRMRPEISQFMKHIYPSLVDDESVKQYEPVKGIGKNIFFLTHNYEETHDQELRSRENYHEAKFIPELCHYLLKQGYSGKDITVLTPYSGQVFRLRKNMPKETFDGVRITAVDNFQGEENEIIIVSLVRSQKPRNIVASEAKKLVGFLKEANRICVTLSRAKQGMYVIGNFSLIEKSNDLWQKILATAKENGMFGDALQLFCQNHPTTKLNVKHSSDFKNVPEGGCMKPCEYRLDKCGHVCARVCHTYDRDHKEYKCLKKCDKIICENNHRCKKICSSKCGSCNVPVDKIVPGCFHMQRVPCSVSPDIFRCQEDCDFHLSCGHKCIEKCGESHTDKCRENVGRVLPCGHNVKMKCFEKVEKYMCPIKCKTILSCEHPCAGTCGTCHQKRLHMACAAKCERNLVCNHICKENCTKACPPCSEQCRNRCVHSICRKRCGQTCRKCMEPCAWKCEHYKCTKKCSEPCNRRQCNQPCKKKLEKCDHFCIGMCGETCPTLCRICDKDTVEEIFFGKEDEADARFVQLHDCGHIIEVTGLDRWMEQIDSKKDGSSIQLKGCPKCKVPIRRNLRYGVQINQVLSDIENVKVKIAGDRGNVTTTCNELKLMCRRKLQKYDVKTYELLYARLAHEEISLAEVNLIENKIKILAVLYALNHSLKELSKSSQEKSLKILLKQLEETIGWLMRPRQRFSDQELTEVELEVERLQIFKNLCMIKINIEKKDFQLSQDLKILMDNHEKCLISKQVITENKKAQMEQVLTIIQEKVPSGGLGVTETERLEIVKAIGLSKGHWYKCPNGHYYAIADCGGATVESRCPECKAKIGGSGHKLRSDNAHAPEVDGSQHAAWSEQANMANYGFQVRF